MSGKVVKYYANLVDISEIPTPVLVLAMSDWFDKGDVIVKSSRIDDMWVRIVGKNEKMVEARVEVLKSLTKVRHGGGVRVKKVRR